MEKNGVLLVNKKVGITSYDVIRKLKPFFPRKYKIGHAGTLDPFAEGLLIILIGKATKLMNSILTLRKTYQCKGRFGFETDTQDITGEIIKEDKSIITKAQFEECCKSFIGKYYQQPPIYSAKKVNGVESYKIARKGEKVELDKKLVEVYDIKVLNFDWPSFEIIAEVSSGTYIRTLIVDIAVKLGTLATATNLTRTQIGSFKNEIAVESDSLSAEIIDKNVIDIDKVYNMLKQ